MKLLRMALVVAGVLAGIAPAATAFAAEESQDLLGIQLTSGTADLYASQGDYLSAYDHSELGVGIQYWRLMSKDYAFALSGGIGGFSETDEAGPAAAPGSPDRRYTQRSWNLRVGGDRAVSVGERAIFYFGPGLEVWSGKAKFENITSPGAYLTQNVMRYSLSARIGGVMLLSERIGLNCQLGTYLGRASAEEQGAKAHWWPSGFQAASGLVILL